MSTLKIDFNTSDQNKFIHDPVKVLIDANGGTFNLIDDLNQSDENYDNDVGFTYDNTKVEFVAGILGQKDLTPLDSIAGATFALSKDLSWGKGVNLAGTLFGGAVLNAELIECLNGDKNASWTGGAFGAMSRKGSIKTHYKPNYSGNPAQEAAIINNYNGVDNKDKFTIYHAPGDGTLRITAYNNLGALFFSAIVFSGAAWVPVANQIYVFELIWDMDNFGFRLIIDGVTIGSIATFAHLRGITANIVSVGSGAVYPYANGSFDNLLVSNSIVQDKNYIVVETIYSASIVLIPVINYAGLGVIQSISSIDHFGVNPPDHSVINNDNTITVTLEFLAGNTREELTKTEVKYFGQAFPSEALIEPQEFSSAEGFEGFSDDVDTPGDSAINYVMKIGNLYYWLNVNVLELSDGTFAQSNNVADWIAELIQITDFISNGAQITMVPVLYSGAGRDQNPVIRQTTLIYDFFALPLSCDECILYGYVKDNCDNIASGTIKVYTKDPIFTQGKLEAFEKIEDIRIINGYFEISIIIPNLPVDPNKPDDLYYFDAEWIDTDGKKWDFRNKKILIPNSPNVLFDYNIIKA